MPRSLFDDRAEELRRWLDSAGQPAFRHRQIVNWVTHRRSTSFDQMTDLPTALREQLSRDWSLFGSTVEGESLDPDRTGKLLIRLADGQRIESVLLAEQDRRTICLSTQVGCGMACVFCASGIGGLVRDLSDCELVEQFLLVRNLLPENERLTHVVVMGMGEPLANLENLQVALDFACSKDGLGISARHVTISTVGLPTRIDQLASSRRPYHLAVSLHAPNDDLRRRIVPTARRIELRDILASADRYRLQTGRQVTFEYVLLAGVNDAPRHARELAELLRGRDAMLNVIPFNPVADLGYATPTAETVRQFATILRREGVVVKTRKRKGSSINAACGQLRRHAESASANREPTVGLLRS